MCLGGTFDIAGTFPGSVLQTTYCPLPGLLTFPLHLPRPTREPPRTSPPPLSVQGGRQLPPRRLHRLRRTWSSVQILNSVLAPVQERTPPPLLIEAIRQNFSLHHSPPWRHPSRRPAASGRPHSPSGCSYNAPQRSLMAPIPLWAPERVQVRFLFSIFFSRSETPQDWETMCLRGPSGSMSVILRSFPSRMMTPTWTRCVTVIDGPGG